MSSSSGHNSHFLPPVDLNLSPIPDDQILSTTEPAKISPHQRSCSGLHPPSPIVTRRDRRQSLSERAARGPVLLGDVKYFCRQKGHGYVTPHDGGDDIFVHISDIEGEFVPETGDVVSYQMCPIPPKFEKQQAVHVCIRDLSPAVHVRWNEPPTPHSHPHEIPNTPETRHPESFHFPNAEAATSHEAEIKEMDVTDK